MCHNNPVVQRQTAVTAYSSSKQLLLFALERCNSRRHDLLVTDSNGWQGRVYVTFSWPYSQRYYVPLPLCNFAGRYCLECRKPVSPDYIALRSPDPDLELAQCWIKVACVCPVMGQARPGTGVCSSAFEFIALYDIKDGHHCIWFNPQLHPVEYFPRNLRSCMIYKQYQIYIYKPLRPTNHYYHHF